MSGRVPNELLYQIEDCRRQMVELAKESSYADEKVVHISTRLDDLLNQYQLAKHN
ncbi:aspartyl-phosphate phosphatase Spo0E family protein [Rossellomorea aquimaris]|uniref:aspartyl-phosphate phosphatase Spo0E family protein n=1 Tax=Rossellomorea aquimaris TaxID=189382 RepID=UPI001CD80DA7|nr:aspartyl-phosphate phosphatase Spo0E family protein [Rossellomorea aquimaris]MCA1057029.1 aspartyl-phosphate phosphatase Spo0E family protein [Rossellomorea aquimaris]